MLKTATKRILFNPSPPRHSTDPLLIAFPRLWEYPLAKFLFALLSAALLICSLPAPDIGWLGWVALVPPILACQGLDPLSAAGLGLMFGIVARLRCKRLTSELKRKHQATPAWRERCVIIP